MFWSYLGLETASIIAKIGISFKTVGVALRTLGDNGYKYNVLKNNSNTKKASKLKTTFNVIISLIPGVNLIPSIIGFVGAHNIDFAKKIFEGQTEEMTLEEKGAYNKLNKKSEKLLFLTVLAKGDKLNQRRKLISVATKDKNLSFDEIRDRTNSINKIFSEKKDKNYNTLSTDKSFIRDVPKEKTENNENHFNNLEQFKDRYERLDELLARKAEREANINNQLESEKPKVKIK